MKTEKIYTRPNYLEVSSHFLHDAIDFELRYRFCFKSDGPLFYEPKSRRIKVFIDLRMGVESALKSFVSYHCSNDRTGKTLINWIEGYRHRIDKLLTKAAPYFPEDFLLNYKASLDDLSSLPVDLRYRFDVWDFYENKEELYDRTIGEDAWLHSIHESLKEIIDLTNTSLKKHTRLIKVEDLIEEMLEPRYERYNS